MALIKCPDCGKMVSDRAQNCPDCGFPIQEEVQRLKDITNIESNEASGEYNNLTEKEVAKKLCEAISKKQFADINVFQSILKNKFAEGYYAKIVEDSRDFSDDESDRNLYIVKNTELILDYLDYPLDAMGIRNWFINKEDRKGKGFFQSDVASFDDFSKYYINCNACEVIDLGNIIHNLYDTFIADPQFKKRCTIASKSRYAVILKENTDQYNELVEKSKKFINAYDNNVRLLRKSVKNDYDTLEPYRVNSMDLIELHHEGYEKTIIDETELAKQMLHAVAQQLTFTSNVKQPVTSIGAKTVAGALLAGPAGALVGYAVGKDKNAKFERSRQYNEEILREREEGRKTLNNLQYGDKPTKVITVTRYYLGFMTYAGTLPFYVDSQHTGQEGWQIQVDGESINVNDRFPCNEIELVYFIDKKYKNNIFERSELARLYIDKNILFPKTSFVEANISKLLQNPNIAEIALDELSKYDSVQFENYAEDHCREEIEKIKDIKNSVIGNSDVCKVADLHIAKIEDSIKVIKQKEAEKEYQGILYQGETASEENLKELILKLKRIQSGQNPDELIEKCSGAIAKFEEKKEELSKKRIEEEQRKKEQNIAIERRKKYRNTAIMIAIAILVVLALAKYSLQGTTQGRYLTGGVPPVRFSM